MTKYKNIFIRTLESLNVKHTKHFANKIFNEHPHKYNLFGLSNLLNTYNINNSGFNINNKEDICRAEAPFIAQVGNDFVLIEKISKKGVTYFWNGKLITLAVDEFIQIWSGVVLIIEADENSIEPEYKIHKQKENINNTKKFIFILCAFSIILLAVVINKTYNFPERLLLLFFNTIGAYVSYLLFLKHIHISNTFGDKICSLFKQADCNNILESEAASLFGIISWSEIGLGYFISNTAIILFFPHLVVWMALINIFALPYSFWSIWHQGVKAKQWCPLCIMVQLLLWIIFSLNLVFGFIRIPAFDVWQMGIIVSIFLIPLLITNTLAPLIANTHRVGEITQEINSIKANEKVFGSLLQEQSRYNVSTDFSRILLGNDSATLFVTVLTNPHCNPCANMHKRIEQLLKEHPHVQVQYIYSSFSQELEISARYLIAVYLQKSREEYKQIYAEWFEDGKFNKELFFEKYLVDINDANVAKEFNRHKAWIKISQLRATPTLLVNGYKLPENYYVEDLKYFVDLEFEI